MPPSHRRSRDASPATSRWSRTPSSSLVSATLSPALDQSRPGFGLDDRQCARFAARPSRASGGRFRVLRPHARGGLGQVYVALDRELGRRVALKEIRVEKASNPSLRSRFLVEAESTATSNTPASSGLQPRNPRRRPAVLRDAVHSGRESQGAIEASTLPRRRSNRAPATCGSGNCSAASSTSVTRSRTHTAGVLHRDLKPANIMLGAYGETLIVDWGLAKAVGRPRSRQRRGREHFGSFLSRQPRADRRRTSSSARRGS